MTGEAANTNEFAFECRTCTETHRGIPSFGADAPHAYLALPEADREEHADLGSDQCIIDDEQFFVRGCLELPVHGHSEPLSWGVWVSVSKEDFQRISELWEAEGRENEPPMFGRLDTGLPGYRQTLQLRTSVHLRPCGVRPYIEVESTDHPLALDQREGLDAERLALLIDRALHGAFHPLSERVHEAFEERWGPSDGVVVFDAVADRISPAPPVPRLDVFKWRADDDTDVASFITCGMASRPMPGDVGARAELHFGVRARLSPEEEHAVARLLANLACYAWADAQSALGFWHTLPVGVAIPRFPHCSSILLHPRMTDEGIDHVQSEDGGVDVLLVLPITSDEHELVRSKGADALLQRWDKEDVDVFVDREPRRGGWLPWRR